MKDAPELLVTDLFLVELEGIAHAGFSACSGLTGRREVLSYAEGGYDGLRRFRGRRVDEPLVLERGFTRDRALREWYESADPRDGAVIVLDVRGRESARFAFTRAWPCAWEGPALAAESTRIAIERLEIVHEGVRWTAG